MMWDIDSLLMLQFILTNMKVAGGPGWGVSLKEELREAVSELGDSEEQLAEFLISVMEGRRILAPGDKLAAMRLEEPR
jgi:hypothetical protein